MRVLVASLGFAYHHVMAAANRPGKMALATVNPENERTKNAIAEIQRYTAVEVKTLDPEDFWRCVGDALDLFAEKHHYYLDVGGGVRALALCLYTAATLAVAHLGADLIAVYTMAEHTEKVEADLRPLLYAGKLMDARAKTRRGTLRNLQKGAVEPTPTVKRISRGIRKTRRRRRRQTHLRRLRPPKATTIPPSLIAKNGASCLLFSRLSFRGAPKNGASILPNSV